jgi:hypothetical protein
MILVSRDGSLALVAESVVISAWSWLNSVVILDLSLSDDGKSKIIGDGGSRTAAAGRRQPDWGRIGRLTKIIGAGDSGAGGSGKSAPGRRPTGARLAEGSGEAYCRPKGAGPAAKPSQAGLHTR